MTVNNIIIQNAELKVTLATTGVTENYTKTINLISFPKTTANRTTDSISANYEENITKVVDILMKAERRYTINAHIVTGLSETPLSTIPITSTGVDKNNATDKKTDLRKIVLHGGNFYMYYEGEWLQVNTDKLEIKRIFRDGIENTDGVSDFDVTITMVQVSQSYG